MREKENDSSKSQQFSLFGTIFVQYASVWSGAAAGFSGTIIGQPLDTVKIRLQTAASTYIRKQKQWIKDQSAASTVFPGRPRRRRRDFKPPSIQHTFSQIVRKEGVKSLWKGVTAPIASLMLINSVSYAVFDETSRKLSAVVGGGRGQGQVAADEQQAQPPALRHRPSIHWGVASLAGALSGLCIGPISAPFEFVKVRAQLDNVRPGGGKHKGSLQVARALLARHRSPRVFFTGFSLQLPRELMYGAVFYGACELLRPLLAHALPDNQLNYIAIPFAGAFGGMFAWLSVYPLDVIKSNVQASRLGPDRPPIRRTVTALARAHANSLGSRGHQHGFKQFATNLKMLRAFYIGSSVAVGRAFLVSAVRFSTFTLALYLLDPQNQRH